MSERYLITGASRGIGRAIAELLATDDVVLLLHGRDTAALESVCSKVEEEGATAVPMVAELADIAGVDQIVKAAGSEPLTALINNAGIAYITKVPDITLEEWNRTFAVNVTAPFLLTQKLLPLMSKGSSILNILSTASHKGYPEWASYCMSKFALDGFAQSLREEVRPQGIRVINIYPGAVNTDIWNDLPGDWPLEKMMGPEEIAQAVVFALRRPSNILVDSLTIGNSVGSF